MKGAKQCLSAAHYLLARSLLTLNWTSDAGFLRNLSPEAEIMSSKSSFQAAISALSLQKEK